MFIFLSTFAIGVSVVFILASATQVSAQNNPYPNELKQYDFFGSGKLKDLKLCYSRKNDIENIFGESCENSCDYDENFTIKFEYMAAMDDCMTTKDIRDRAMCPQSDFVGTISSITLEPKQTQILKDIPTSKFNKFSGGGTVEKGSGVSVSYRSFTDNFGLTYSILSENTSYSQYPRFVEGKLYSIKYILTDELIRKVFTVEYMTRKN